MSERVTALKNNSPVPLWVRLTAVGALSVGMAGCGSSEGRSADATATTTASVSATGEAKGGSTQTATPETSAPAAVNCGAGTIAVNGTCEIAPAGGSSKNSNTSTHEPATHSAAPAPAHTAARTTAPAHNSGPAGFVFDSHGSDISKGGSNVIQVYADYSQGGRGTENGTFMDGQERVVDCYVEGRSISRIEGQGETPGSSSTWYKLDGMSSYATGAYGAPVSPVPHC